MNLQKKAVSEAHGFMQECEAYCQKKGVKASYKVVSESPAKAILDHAKNKQKWSHNYGQPGTARHK